tara:strand:- start:65 stop:382 length:318 start_codon:yes stop_codon:yes gene_type:complete
MKFDNKSEKVKLIGNKSVTEVINMINHLCTKHDVPYSANDNSVFEISSESELQDLDIVARDLSLNSRSVAKGLMDSFKLDVVWIDGMLAGYIHNNKFVLALNPAY